MAKYTKATATEIARIHLDNHDMEIRYFNETTGEIKVSFSNTTFYKTTPDNTPAYSILYQMAMEQRIRKEMQSHNSDYGYAPRREVINAYKCR